jgi:hypothetical protein
MVVAVTVALSYMVYSEVRVPVAARPIFVASSTERFGSPSVLELAVNSSAPTSVSEFRVDGASSLSGVLALSGSGYTSSDSLCAAGETTFFSVLTGSGLLSVTGPGSTIIDGSAVSSEAVSAGWHQLMISDSAACTVTLPGGTALTYPSADVSTVPFAAAGSRSFVFLIPFVSVGHTVTISFAGGVEVYGF